jgi:hypothetical protein
MAGRLRLRKIPIQPVTQPTVELAGHFAVDSFTLTEDFVSELKLSRSIRRLFESPDEGHQLHELVVVKFFQEQSFLLILELKDFLLSFSVRLSPNIHAATRAGESWCCTGHQPPLNRR